MKEDNSGFPKKADHSPVMVGSGQGKERNCEKEFEANEGFKGQRTKLCKTRVQGEFPAKARGSDHRFRKRKRAMESWKPREPSSWKE